MHLTPSSSASRLLVASRKDLAQISGLAAVFLWRWKKGLSWVSALFKFISTLGSRAALRMSSTCTAANCVVKTCQAAWDQSKCDCCDEFTLQPAQSPQFTLSDSFYLSGDGKPLSTCALQCQAKPCNTKQHAHHATCASCAQASVCRWTESPLFPSFFAPPKRGPETLKLCASSRSEHVWTHLKSLAC